MKLYKALKTSNILIDKMILSYIFDLSNNYFIIFIVLINFEFKIIYIYWL